MRIKVAQGANNMFAGNNFLGELEISNLRQGMRGEVQISVTFAIQPDGALQIRATDTHTGTEARTSFRIL